MTVSVIKNGLVNTHTDAASLLYVPVLLRGTAYVRPLSKHLT